jgi:ABC-type nickel/cobalt efflux system permease component RcnA
MSSLDLEQLFAAGRRNAVLSWLFVALAAIAWIGGIITVGPLWSVFAFVIVVLAVLPPLVYRSRYVMLPWEVLAMATLPLIGIAVGAQRLSSPIVTYLAIAAVGLVIVVELDSFTMTRLSAGFAIALVIAATMAAAAVWALLEWYAAVLFDQVYTMTNDQLMHEFVYATVAGFGAGTLFRMYFRRRVSMTERVPTSDREPLRATERQTDEESGGQDVSQRGIFHRFLPSKRRQHQLTRGMELILVGLLFIGIERGSTGIIVNTGVSLAVVQLPAILERDYDIPMDPRLTLWVTLAAFLHAVGVVGIPGSGLSFYTTIGWWDHLTHSLSASVVAAAGYATVRALDIHLEEVHISPKVVSVVLLICVLAFGVLWELLEFAIGVAADEFGTGTILTQYGIEDTLKDLTFNTFGGIIVALWGGVYLTDLADTISERLNLESTTR